MTRRHAALVIGEALVDIIRTGKDLRHYPGGSCANVAVALARLGRPTLLATRYGDDRLGGLLEKHLAGSGVEIRHGSRQIGARTSTAEAELRPDGSATYRFDLTWDVALDDLEPAAHPVVHVGSIGAQLQPGADTVERAVEALRATAIVSYDLNARPALFGKPSTARQRVARLVASSDIAKASDEDLGWLYPNLSIEEAAARWLELGAAAVLVTRAGNGASVFTSRERVDVAGAPVEVVDTIGAGDTFSAAVEAHRGVRRSRGRRGRLPARGRSALFRRIATQAVHGAGDARRLKRTTTGTPNGGRGRNHVCPWASPTCVTRPARTRWTSRGPSLVRCRPGPETPEHSNARRASLRLLYGAGEQLGQVEAHLFRQRVGHGPRR